MPSYKTKQIDENGRNVYKDICFPITKDFREKLNGVIMQGFEQAKENRQEAASAVSKQCNLLKEQVREVKQEICEKAGKIVEGVKQKGKKALYRVAEITGVRKRLLSIKDKVDRAIDRVENLEQSVGEYHRQGKDGQSENPLLGEVVAEPQPEYGAELFEQYQREHGTEQVVEAVGQVAKQEVGKSR